MIENLKLFMGTIAESNSGQRILKLAPQLMAVKDVQSLMEVRLLNANASSIIF